MPLAALRGRLRGERPRSEGRGDTGLVAVLLVVPVRIPRRVAPRGESARSGGVKPNHTLLWSGSVRLDTTSPG